jgi:hypothetical protein
MTSTAYLPALASVSTLVKNSRRGRTVGVGLDERVGLFEVGHDFRVVGQAERSIENQLALFLGALFEKRFSLCGRKS